MNLQCAICKYVKRDHPFDAVTIKGGTAVCEKHLGHASDSNVTAAIARLPVKGGSIQYEDDHSFPDREGT